MATDLRFWDAAAREALLTWHAGLEHDKGGRAELRRIEEPAEAVFVRAFHRLRAALQATASGADFEGGNRLDRLAAIACLAARVKEHVKLSKERGEYSLASLFARPAEGAGRPRVSEARFRRLMETEEIPDLLRQMRRILALLDDRVDLEQLADAVYGWGHDRIRQRWALDYYRALPAESGAAGQPAQTKGA